MKNADKVMGLLSEAQLSFIEAELGGSRSDVGNMSDEEIAAMYDRICDIEVNETIDANEGDLSERGKMAERIVTILGNELYRPEDEPDDEG